MTSSLTNSELAREVALDLVEGTCVNLGIGLPSLVAKELPEHLEVIFHSENGIVGMGPPPPEGQEDPNLIDAGKAPATLRTGGAFIGHCDSFGLIRGGYIDVSVMGALEVASSGDLANWSTGGGVPGVGGAMDLACCARRVVVVMRHFDKRGRSKLVGECSVPVTARGCVRRVYTDLGTFDPLGTGGFQVVGLARGRSLAEVQQLTPVQLVGSEDVVTLPRPAPGEWRVEREPGHTMAADPTLGEHR